MTLKKTAQIYSHTPLYLREMPFTKEQLDVKPNHLMRKLCTEIGIQTSNEMGSRPLIKKITEYQEDPTKRFCHFRGSSPCYVEVLQGETLCYIHKVECDLDGERKKEEEKKEKDEKEDEKEQEEKKEEEEEDEEEEEEEEEEEDEDEEEEEEEETGMTTLCGEDGDFEYCICPLCESATKINKQKEGAETKTSIYNRVEIVEKMVNDGCWSHEEINMLINSIRTTPFILPPIDDLIEEYSRKCKKSKKN